MKINYQFSDDRVFINTNQKSENQITTTTTIRRYNKIRLGLYIYFICKNKYT